MTFANLLDYLHNLPVSDAVQLRIDSRLVKEGDIFIAVAGASEDGAKYIDSAMQAGAKIIVCEQKLEQSEQAQKNDVQFVYVENTRQAVWQLAKAYYKTAENCKQNNVKIIGITGTNGKTTSAYLLEHLYIGLGHKVGVMGTVNYRWHDFVQEAPLTTPDSITIHAMLHQMIEAGVDVVIMEVSSHALMQERVGGIEFSGAIFTNLTQDHLDFHQDMQGYFDAKAKLFVELPCKNKVMSINTDDVWGVQLKAICKNSMSYGLKDTDNLSENHVVGRMISMTPAGIHLQMQCGQKTWELKTPLVGAFNALNLLSVQTLALGLGLLPEQMKVLEGFYGVCGRLERVQNSKNLNVFVDYAHTPDALVNVLAALRGAGFTKIITVFGCGGNRDRTKRPLMGKAVAENCEIAVLTSDNPRFENPADIIADVLPGLQESSGLEIVVEADRKLATKKALELLQNEDVLNTAVLIAGKGHEDYQIIEGVKYPYSDQKTVQELV